MNWSIGDEVRVPGGYGVHDDQVVTIVAVHDDRLVVECEDEHVFSITLADLDRPGDNEVVYAVSVSDVEAMANRPITRDEFYRVQKAIDHGANEAIWDAINAALAS